MNWREACQSCIFNRTQENAELVTIGFSVNCVRFPRDEAKRPKDWCGEYKRDHAKEIFTFDAEESG